MALRVRAAAAAVLVLILGVGFSGCLTVYPAKNLLSTDPRDSSITYGNVRAYNRTEALDTDSCSGGSDTRLIYVPPKSQWVEANINAFLKAVPAPANQLVNQHFDMTLKDGAGVVWVDIHLKGNDTAKRVQIEGPRPGAWNVDLSWKICRFPPLGIDDHFDMEIVVRQPV